MLKVFRSLQFKMFLFVLIVFAVILFAFNPFSPNKIQNASMQYEPVTLRYGQDVFSSSFKDLRQPVSISDTVQFIDIMISDDLSREYVKRYSYTIDSTLDVEPCKIINYDLIDNQWLRLNIPTDADLSGQRTLVISSASSSLTPFVATTSINPAFSFIRDSMKENRSLIMRYGSVSSPVLYYILWGSLFVFSLCFALLFKRLSIRSFIVFSLCFGLVLCCAIPYPNGVNEAETQSRAFALANGLIDTKTENVLLPENTLTMLNYQSAKDFALSDVYANHTMPFAFGIPVLALFTSLLFTVVSRLGLSLFWYAFVSRALLLVVNIAGAAVAIHSSKNHRPLFYLLAALPVSLCMFSSAAHVSLVYTLTLIFLSLILNFMEYAMERSKRSCALHYVCYFIILLLIGCENFVLFIILSMFVFVCFSSRYDVSSKVYPLVSSFVFLVVTGLHVANFLIHKEYYSDALNNILSGFSSIAHSPFDTLSACTSFAASILNDFLSDLSAFSVYRTISICSLFAALMFALWQIYGDPNTDEVPSGVSTVKVSKARLRACVSCNSLLIISSVLFVLYLLILSFATDYLQSSATLRLMPFFAVFTALLRARRAATHLGHNDGFIGAVLLCNMILCIAGCLA